MLSKLDKINDEITKIITIVSSAKSDVNNGLYTIAAASLETAADRLRDISNEIRDGK